MDRKRLALLLVLIALVGAFLFHPTRASAQEPTAEPTATPTPAYQESIQLSSGNQLVIERRITYGEIAIVGSILLLVVVVVLYLFIRVPRLWLH